MSFITSKIMLGVDDHTRHWLYTNPRTAVDKAASIHQDDMGGATVNNVEQPIYNGRGGKDLKLDDASFELVKCPTKLSTKDFYSLQAGDGDLAIQYNEEVEAFVAKQIGCDKVICVQSQVRNNAKEGEDGVQGYAGGGPHTDSSSVSADIFALNTLKGSGLKGSDYKRYCYLNLWRNIGDHTIEDNHLALLDERTVVKPDDYLPKDVIGDGYEVTQYLLNARHAAQHKWYYFPNMTRNEAILFKQMDSDGTLSGRVCFHMSVSDPTASKTAPPRESIEIRMLCFWKDAAVDSMPTSNNVRRDMMQSPKEYAIQLKGGSNLESASVLELFLAICRKLPLVGGLFGRLLDGYLTGKAKVAPIKYSGNASDYLDRFVKALDAFPSWHKSSNTWAKVQMKRQKTARGGIEGITTTLVEDQLGFQKTRNFSQQAKAEIVTALLESDKYMEVCKRYLEPLLD
mmetsp:Transcript_36237/g.66574  ORF Transcript_36237/g.66574 Transcript_36237/m.66574 type:complete len:456 (-) Transcript_36237:169-1536(-)|eukprot:CAMPEP_0202019020 /NCGR_PEP_ID=MMETSP0905-20130828/40893_1 /ASSEMBLY_ACC=CAM_ASM_000554 /TAXON_ID=420261 /ORGANISM="Thalassiosira antarctica, Strain CCMP982" /LENGTH=455 /DNA_ID=CAMNT_0048580147 /DNA_START=26 /DNA_END=1393 /DNA_ORIENTATION=+